MSQSASYTNDVNAATHQHVTTTVQNNTQTTSDDSGTANTYVVSVNPAPNVVEYTAVTFLVKTTNTTASTLALNGGTAIAIKKNGAVALAAGDLKAGQFATVMYDGTNWQLISSTANQSPTFAGSLTITGGTVTTSAPLITGTQTWNDANITFDAFKVTVTNTASAAASTLAKLLVGTTTMFEVDEAGNTYLGGGNASGTALATTAITGFPIIPNMAGTPTGNTTLLGGLGKGAMVLDTTAHKIWFNEGNASWKFANLS